MMSSPSRWWERPNRVLLVNLREGDEPKIQAQQLVQDVKSFGATAFCLNGGGIVAFYQTRIPDHRVSSGLGGRDRLGDLVPAAHQPGVHVPSPIGASWPAQAPADTPPARFAPE